MQSLQVTPKPSQPSPQQDIKDFGEGSGSCSPWSPWLAPPAPCSFAHLATKPTHLPGQQVRTGINGHTMQGKAITAQGSVCLSQERVCWQDPGFQIWGEFRGSGNVNGKTVHSFPHTLSLTISQSQTQAPTQPFLPQIHGHVSGTCQVHIHRKLSPGLVIISRLRCFVDPPLHRVK